MRWTKIKAVDSERVKTWFALLPVTIGDETRWLERVSVKQRRGFVEIRPGVSRVSWSSVEFVEPYRGKLPRDPEF